MDYCGQFNAVPQNMIPGPLYHDEVPTYLGHWTMPVMPGRPQHQNWPNAACYGFDNQSQYVASTVHLDANLSQNADIDWTYDLGLL